MKLKVSLLKNLLLKNVFLAVLLLCGVAKTYATHNRAGEIIYTKLPGTSHRYSIRIITYTEINNQNADRPELGIDFGDNTTDSVRRSSKGTFPGQKDIQFNYYDIVHTYPGPGTYKIWVEDPNRNGGVINIPNSINTVFYIESELNITAGEDNNSPILKFPPIDFACANSPFYHNPGASDIDGDSLVYFLEPCKSDSGRDIPGYEFPKGTNKFELDSFTGTLTWDSPKISGEYNIAIRIEEYRTITTPNGKKSVIFVGSVLRDMQITVDPGCNNKPPEFKNLNDYCVVVGDTLEFTVIGTDVNDNSPIPGNAVSIEVEGAPFEIDPKALYNVRYDPGVLDPVYLDVFWAPACNQVQKRDYDVFYKIADNGHKPLSNFATSTIKVIAPAIPNFQADAQASSINLTWDSPICLQAQGYRIYRREDSTGYVPDSCETGVPGYLGYELIAEIEDIDELSYLDDNGGQGLIPGELYCYLIITYFRDGAESIASAEVCAQLKKDVPILTNVSIRQTAENTGSALVAWSKPTEFDQTQYPGPYRYRVYRTEKRKFQNFSLIDSLNGINDTSYVDTNLNTKFEEYAYKIEIVDLSETPIRTMGSSVVGTSIYLNSNRFDNRLELNWGELVPWQNKKYVVLRLKSKNVTIDDCDLHRKSVLSFEFDSALNKNIVVFDTNEVKVLDTLEGQSYTDSNLTNLKTYYYIVYSIGEYSISSISKPLYNFSQLHCNSPVDLEPPCPPVVTLSVDDCDLVQDQLLEDPSRCSRGEFLTPDPIDRVLVSWEDQVQDCDPDDIEYYDLFYSPTLFDDFVPVANFKFNESPFEHNLNNTRAGCYYMTATDSFENVSPVIDTVCTDNCLLYKLPNVFTPNGDGQNDVFEPFPFCFVESIDLKIFNRWGLQVFSTEDPFIKWDGINENTKQPVSDGVYFYTCTVRQISAQGSIPIELKGNVHILGSASNTTE